MTDPILVIDVSHHNGARYDMPDGLPRSHFRELKRNGIEAVYIKVTEGVSHIDEDAAKHVAKAREVGMAVGLYHFAHDGDVDAQLDHFLTNAKAVNGGTLDDLLLVIDAEWASWADAAKGPTIRRLGRGLQERTTNTIALYTARGYILAIGNPQLADTYDVLINAAWDGEKHRMVDINAPALPPRAGYGGWKWRPKFCQIGPLHYGVDGKQHTVDLDLYYGSREKFDALWTTPKPPPDPDETPADPERYLAEYNGRVAVIAQAVRELPESPSEGGKEATADVLELLGTLHIGKVV